MLSHGNFRCSTPQDTDFLLNFVQGSLYYLGLYLLRLLPTIRAIITVMPGLQLDYLVQL